jgi:hypothetical protein
VSDPHRIHVRESFPLVVTVQLGLLVTLLSWVFLGAIAGSFFALASALLVWRALQSGLAVDERGVEERPFLPTRTRVVPWTQLRSVDVDEVVTGTNEGRSTKVRVRFMTETEQLQLVGCRPKVADRVIEVFRNRGLPATDTRPAAR